MAANIHVSISAETVANIAGFQISNSMLTGTIVSLLIIGFALYFSQITLKKKNPGRLQNIVETIIEGIYNLCRDIAGEKKARDFFPLIASFLIYIILNNWFGLLPGVGTIGITHPIEVGTVSEVHAAEETHEEEAALYGVAEVEEEYPGEESHESEEHSSVIPLFRAATADLNGTLALALISMFMVQFYGFKYLGGSYVTKFFNFKQGPIFTFVGLLELLSDISKIISFAFRLFGNIFAGEVLLVVIFVLTSSMDYLPLFGLGTVPFLFLEIFVGFVQALVFAMLSLVFINMATISHDH